MTTTEVPAVQPPAAAPPPRPNGFARIIGVLFSPNDTFASIARQPDWVVPLVVILIVSLLAGIVFAQRVDFTGPAREAMEARNMPQDQIDRTVRITAAVSKVLSYCSPVVSVIFLLIIAAILLVAFRLFGGEGDFRQSFAVTCYGWMPGVLKSIILTVIVAVRGASAMDLATLIRSNLAFLVPMKTNPLLFALLSKLDIFTFWLLALFIIGWAFVAKFSKAKSAAIVISLWIIATLLALIGPAIQTMRK
ncbi:MAG TPA: YIP1 family protein [Thermoanaerobaculia bacterium]|nr:YIP1 family protein [Thermoanaerobaculia bacterium]